jgi:hypothetical protein
MIERSAYLQQLDDIRIDLDRAVARQLHRQNAIKARERADGQSGLRGCV